MPGFPRLKELYDIVVVGGGHAGLQAGLKAALLHQTAAIIDRGPKYSRSFYAPRMDNIPGFPDGISGHKLLDQQIAAVHKQEDRTGYFTPGIATKVERTSIGYDVSFEWLKQSLVARGRAVVLATGVVDRMPIVAGKLETIFPWANFGIVDFCILCDGHELTQKEVAVLGHDGFAARTALDLLHFEPKSVEILTFGEPFLQGESPTTRTDLEKRLADSHIGHIETPVAGVEGIREKTFQVRFTDGSQRHYEKGFSGLGWYDMHSEIPRSLGARFDPEGYVVTDEDCRVISHASGEPIPGLYCVGDLRNGWNQIPEAWATAERAVIHAYSYFL